MIAPTMRGGNGGVVCVVFCAMFVLWGEAKGQHNSLESLCYLRNTADSQVLLLLSHKSKQHIAVFIYVGCFGFWVDIVSDKITHNKKHRLHYTMNQSLYYRRQFNLDVIQRWKSGGQSSVGPYRKCNIHSIHKHKVVFDSSFWNILET